MSNLYIEWDGQWHFCVLDVPELDDEQLRLLLEVSFSVRELRLIRELQLFRKSRYGYSAFGTEDVKWSYIIATTKLYIEKWIDGKEVSDFEE